MCVCVCVFVGASSFKFTSTAQTMSEIQAIVVLDVKTNVIRPLFLWQNLLLSSVKIITWNSM
jgi:hypothetical protein